MLPVFLAFQSQPPPGAPVDLVAAIDRAAELFPARHAAFLSNGARLLPGYVDLLWLSLFLDPALAGFDRFWLVEYDVDFSGDWSDFFSTMQPVEADLLATQLRWRRDNPGWKLLAGIADPRNDPSGHAIGFMPVSRFSRRLVERYRQEFARPGWSGHFELLLPTIALRAGFTAVDLGGDGSFTLAAPRNRFYEGTFADMGRGTHTFAYRPARVQHYFGESRFGFWRPGSLYHPVKVGLGWKPSLAARWVMFRDRLRARFAGSSPPRKN